MANIVDSVDDVSRVVIHSEEISDVDVDVEADMDEKKHVSLRVAGAGYVPRSPSIIKHGTCGGINPTKNKQERSQPSQTSTARRKLIQVTVLCLLFMVAELVGGLLANSLAIMTDAAHLLSDMAGFLISLFAMWLSNRSPTSRLSYGYHRAEILGALLSVLLIWILTGVLLYESVMRLKEPEDVDGKLMFIVATCGLGVNLAMGYILHQSGHGHSHGLGGGHGHSHGGGHGHSHGTAPSPSHDHAPADAAGGTPVEQDINVKAAFIHVVGDGIQSLGVMIAAALIWYNPEWKIADAVTTFVFALLVLLTTSRLIQQAVAVLMEGVPPGVDPSAVLSTLFSVAGVLSVHDLHIWAISVGKPSLSVHLLTSDDDLGKKVLSEAHHILANKFNIHHTTIQVEKQSDRIACNSDAECGDDVV